MKTYRGIYTDIEESDYIYEFLSHKFYFSSMFYLEKYKEEVYKFIKLESQKIYLKYRVPISLLNLDLFLAIFFYKKIEKRGYKIMNKDGINILK